MHHSHHSRTRVALALPILGLAATLLVPAAPATAGPNRGPSAPATAEPDLAAPAPTTSGANLLDPDSASFSSGTGGWMATGATIARVTSPYQSAPGALKATATAVGNIGLLSGKSTSTYTPVQAGATYAADAWVRADRTARTVQPVISFYDSTGKGIRTAFGGGTVEDRRTYTQTLTVQAVAPSGSAYAVVGLIVYGVAKSEVHYVDTVRLEQVAAPAAPLPAQPLLGFFDQPAGDYGDFTRLDAVERWQGRGHAVVGIYTNFDTAEIDPAFAKMDAIWAHGSVPMVSWMPVIGTARGVDYNKQIAGGSHDTFVRTFTTRLKAFLAGPDAVYGNDDDRRVYLRLAHEANGNWYPYAPSYDATPVSSFVAMWKRVHDLVVSEGVNDPTRAAWVFSVNNTDAGTGPATEAMYPGDAYVDWVSIDGYNWGTSQVSGWQSPAQVFGPMAARLRALTTRPLAIDEVGATTDGFTVADKAQWITDYFAWVKANDVRRTMWFNAYPAMWEVFGGQYGDEVVDSYNAYSTYRVGAADPTFVVGDRASARLLTDDQFTGR